MILTSKPLSLYHLIGLSVAWPNLSTAALPRGASRVTTRSYGARMSSLGKETDRQRQRQRQHYREREPFSGEDKIASIGLLWCLLSGMECCNFLHTLAVLSKLIRLLLLLQYLNDVSYVKEDSLDGLYRPFQSKWPKLQSFGFNVMQDDLIVDTYCWPTEFTLFVSSETLRILSFISNSQRQVKGM